MNPNEGEYPKDTIAAWHNTPPNSVTIPPSFANFGVHPVSVYLAISSPNTNFLIVYSLYFINAVTGLISAIYRGSGSIALMNGFYVMVNTFGLLKAIR